MEQCHVDVIPYPGIIAQPMHRTRVTGPSRVFKISAIHAFSWRLKVRDGEKFGLSLFLVKAGE